MPINTVDMSVFITNISGSLQRVSYLCTAALAFVQRVSSCKVSWKMVSPEIKKKKKLLFKAGYGNQKAPSDLHRGSLYFIRPKVLNGGCSARGGQSVTLRDCFL